MRWAIVNCNTQWTPAGKARNEAIAASKIARYEKAVDARYYNFDAIATTSFGTTRKESKKAACKVLIEKWGSGPKALIQKH